MNKRYLSSRELAEVLGYSQLWVQTMAREGKIPSLRIGKRGKYRFDPEKVLAKLEEAKSAPNEGELG